MEIEANVCLSIFEHHPVTKLTLHKVKNGEVINLLIAHFFVSADISWEHE